jgi:nucleotide-binding universal stress UspA family protein
MNMDIAVGLDGSESSWKAFHEALALAKFKNRTLHIISVQEGVEASYSATEMLAADKTSKDKLQKIHTEAQILAKQKEVQLQTAVVIGSPVEAMVKYLKNHNIEIFVIGYTGHSSIFGALLGTQAEKIVRHSPCSVFIVR